MPFGKIRIITKDGLGNCTRYLMTALGGKWSLVGYGMGPNRKVLMPSAATLAQFVTDNPTNFAELVSSCRKILSAWVSAGGESTDDLVIGFCSIESQADDVGRWDREREEDEADFYRVFYSTFITERDEVRRLIEGQPTAP